MGKITISGAMPDEIGNGLAPFADDFMGHEKVVVPVVAFLAVDKVTRKVRTGEEFPTLALLHWEVVTDEGDIKAHADILGRRLAVRTGAAELPYEAGGQAPAKGDPFPEENDPGE